MMAKVDFRWFNIGAPFSLAAASSQTIADLANKPTAFSSCLADERSYDPENALRREDATIVETAPTLRKLSK